MKLSRAWIGGGFGLATLVGSVLALSACGGDDDGNPGPSGGAPGGAGAPAAGSPGAGAPAAGSPGFGGNPSTGGTGVGGSAPTAGTGGGAGTAGSGTGGPFACAGKAATCSIVSDFPATTAAGFGSGDFTGGVSVFGAGLMRDNTKTDALHVTGKVMGYGHGFNVWFSFCSSFAGSTGISFKVSGTAGTLNTFNFEPQSNSNYPWQPRPEDKKGNCTAVDATMPWNDCVPGSKTAIPITTTATEVMVPWTEIMGGMPVTWSPTMSPTELIGLQWQFPWSAADTAYDVDITIDDIKIVGATPATACPVIGTGGGPGTGGAGGGGGAGGSTAGAGGSTAGAGGSTAGAGGASGSGGSGGSGGAAGSGGSGGSTAGSGGTSGSSS